MAPRYLYRFDGLINLRKQSRDPFLRARRIKQQPAAYPHWQIGDALESRAAGEGVFSLSMWRSLRPVIPMLREQYGRGPHLDPEIVQPLILQRIHADHPFFSTFLRGDDQYLIDQAWLFWKTEPCTDDQDWSTYGIPHSEIEAYHPGGYWAPLTDVVPNQDAPPPPLPDWKRLTLEPGYMGEPERTMDARWIDHASFGRCVFARVPVWSPGVWPNDWGTLQALAWPLLSNFPDLMVAGRLFISLERTGYQMVYEVDIRRHPAYEPSWWARLVRRAQRRPAMAEFQDAESLLPGTAKAAGIYAAAGLDLAEIELPAYVYGREALAALEAEAAPMPHSRHRADVVRGGAQSESP